MTRLLIALAITLPLLLACGEEPELPPAAPLSAPESAVRALYAIAPGPLQVKVQRELLLPAAGDRREMRLNIYYPGEGLAYPLLLFSHGNWSGRNSYDRVIEHWVSHGYAVIAPDHLDCCSMAQGIFNSLRYGQFGLIAARVTDLENLLQSLPEIEALAPAFAGKADASRVAMTGHSFGAFSAQQFAGAAAFDSDRGEYVDAFTARVAAVVALSPPGPMFDTITADSWNTLRAPTLVTTGTWDVQKGFWPEYRMHLMSHERAQPGAQYALVVDGADHYLGNLICRLEREATPQYDALAMINSVTTAFLDAQLKHSETARAYLESDRVVDTTAGFAWLERR